MGHSVLQFFGVPRIELGLHARRERAYYRYATPEKIEDPKTHVLPDILRPDI